MNAHTIGHNASLRERLTYTPETVTTDELVDALVELEEWQALSDKAYAVVDSTCETPTYTLEFLK